MAEPPLPSAHLHGLAEQSSEISSGRSGQAKAAARLPVFAAQEVPVTVEEQECQATVAFTGGPLCAVSCAPADEEQGVQYLAVRWQFAHC